MNKSPYYKLFIVFFLLSCEAKKNYPDVIADINSKSAVEIIDATRLGIQKDGLTDNSALIQAAIGSNRNLYFPKGKYLVSKFINISGVSNLKISGDPETEFITSQNKIFTISGNITNLEISGIRFSSVKKDAINDPEGLIFIAAYGANDLMNGININNCSFSNPNTHANGIKLVSEGINSSVKNISITNNRFENIGRFAVEFQNHERKILFARFRDYTISDNYFSNVGTIQASPAPSCISVSGYSVNGKINNNEIVEMRMNTASDVYYGIENAGTVGLETIGNKMRATTYGFTGILSSGPTAAESAVSGQPKIKDWTIRDNVIELTGQSHIDKVRGIELTDVESYIITGNTITTKGYAMRLIACKSGKINNNTCKVTSGNVLYFQSGSANNEIRQNILDASKGPDHGVVMFNGGTTTGNSASANTLIKTGGLPGSYVNWDGASNNF
ncbi:MAG TPA: glycosyl hydrolase family 28-related protein [Pedobacter sp.]|uniref:glycosyl hydrolase family 28-related protein n=1 Tax=Pedobacter sp. TaxID=1411316 RepID=UPI002BDA3D8B|nr:glycosyl hydrolase family 28-related protein [Pedobacter sp.]HMI01432.1 glycosyl hydrolase family 28-related protein [Pedobacter sp.]